MQFFLVQVRFKNMLLLLLLCSLLSFSSQQCLTARDEVRQVSQEAHRALMRSELQFSIDLFHTVGSLNPNSNLLMSPSSVFRALLLSYFLSANHTEAALRTALRLPHTQDKLDMLGAYNLETYYQKLRSIVNKDYELSSANRLYVSKNLRMKQCFKVLFGEELIPANFEKYLSRTVKKINEWVAGKTRKVITDLLQENSLTKDTLMVLVNAAYFKGNWKTEFDPEYTENDKFYLSNGTVVSIPMMTQENMFKLREISKLDADVLELPYNGDEISMLLMLPVKKSASAVSQLLTKLDSQTLQDTVKALANTSLSEVSVSMPKFTQESSFQLTEILESMGVGDLFQATADLSRLTGLPGIGFTDAVHKAKLKVDEKGTEAAAATSLISVRFGSQSFVANRPFVYLLYDKLANTILFFGVFNSPQLT